MQRQERQVGFHFFGQHNSVFPGTSRCVSVALFVRLDSYLLQGFGPGYDLLPLANIVTRRLDPSSHIHRDRRSCHPTLMVSYILPVCIDGSEDLGCSLHLAADG
jgi:hypothetical protein